MKLVNLVPLKELDINDPALMKYRASRTVNKADNPMDKPSKPTRDLTYAKKLKLDMLKAKRDQLMRDMEQEAEPEGGPIADRYGAQLNKIDAAMAKLRGTKNMTYNQAIGLKETTEKAWNAIDVSRKAEKEISNKEWNERTAKKLDILKKLNDMGKFKKDFDDERLQGWIDQNYSWEKLSKQFKLNEVYSEMYAPEQNTTAGEFNVNVPVQNEMESVNIKYGHATGPVDDVTISWGNESHNVDFEAEDVIDDHGNEGKDMTFVAYSQDDKWRFIVDVSVGFNYENSGEIYEVHWDTLEIAVDDSMREGKVCESCGQIHEGSCGYTHTTDGNKLRTPGGTKGMDANKRTMSMMREVIKKEIKRLHENK